MSSQLRDESPSLFTQEENPWESFERSAREFNPKPVDAWKWMYEKWKELYRGFRTLEQRTLYAVSKQVAVKPDEGTLRSHRQSISYLVLTGEALVTQLDQIAGLLRENPDKEEAHQMKLRVGTLLESLRESMELWHPANKMECPPQLKGIFDR